MSAGDIHAALGQVGLPMPVRDLASRDWDVVLVGGGHNGLTAAAYLARAGKSVLVLEARARLGGACTLEEPFADPAYKVSPCAYVVGLLDPIVIDELELRRHGYNVFVADPGIWCPFDDGTSYVQFLDHETTLDNLRENGFTDTDIEGQFAYEAFFGRMRRALREGTRDAWMDDAPDRAELESLLGHDPELIDTLFHAAIADVIPRYCKDERLHTALYGQGVIGAWAGPRDPGTASIKLMHFSGTIENVPMAWGYVEGGMGRISFAIAEAAAELGVVLASGVRVARIVPGEGVELESGERINARVVVSNADPKVTLALCGAAAAPTFRERVDRWRVQSPVLKLNCALGRLPTWTAAPGADYPNRAPVSIALPIDEAQAAFEECTRGIPRPGFAELYFQSAYDASVAPAGKHTMSAFVQYAPYELADGNWDTRRDQIGRQVLDLIGRFSPDIHDCVEEIDVLGPPDIEQRIGLSGGHIFQGECMPDQMWTNRFAPRTEMPGVYLCGAATHPAGSVIALNGRNAAMAVLADLAPE
ncbi:MAG: crtI [Actinomycetia bacterium]|nr:crtI [Actinomycetes bacterium]